MHPNVAAYFAPNNRIQTTYCQAELPTVRQSYLLSGRLSAVMKLAPNNRIHAPNRSIDMHPKGIDMHPNVSIYFAPNNRILAQVAFLRKT